MTAAATVMLTLPVYPEHASQTREASPARLAYPTVIHLAAVQLIYAVACVMEIVLRETGAVTNTALMAALLVRLNQ